MCTSNVSPLVTRDVEIPLSWRRDWKNSENFIRIARRPDFYQFDKSWPTKGK